jgi:hypothetical protein
MEEFDSKCLMELYEEEFIESCFEELFEEEEQFAEEMEQYLAQLTQDQVGSLVRQLDAVSVADGKADELLTRLNPEAPVFVPSSNRHPVSAAALAAAATAAAAAGSGSGSGSGEDDDCPK